MANSNGLITKSPFYLAAATFAAALILCVANEIYLGVAVILGAVWALALTLHAPVLMLMAWIASGPLLSGWLGAALGDKIPALTPDRVLVFVLASVSAVRWLGRPARFTPPGPIDYAMGAFLAVAMVSMVASGGSPGVGGGLYRDFIFLAQSYGIPFTGFVLARNLIRTQRQFMWLLGALIFTDVLAAVLGLVQFLGGVTSFRPNRFETATTSERAMGVFASPIEFGYCMSTGLIIIMVLWLRTRRVGLRLVLAGLALPMMVAIVLAKSRAPWIGFALGAAVVSIYDARLRRAVIGAGVAGAVALVAAAVFLPQVMDLREFEARVFELSPILNRIALTATSVNMILAHPVFGWGFYRMAFIVNKPEFISNFGGIPTRFSDPGVPHNEIMHVLVLVGVVGFLPYMMIFVNSFRMLIRSVRALPIDSLASQGGDVDLRRDVVLITMATLVMFIFNGMSVDIGLFLHGSNQLYVLLGTAAGTGVGAAAVAREQPGTPLESRALA